MIACNYNIWQNKCWLYAAVEADDVVDLTKSSGSKCESECDFEIHEGKEAQVSTFSLCVCVCVCVCVVPIVLFVLQGAKAC